MPGVVIYLSVATSISTTPRPTHTPFVDPRPSYMPRLTMPPVSRDFPYSMSIVMMTWLHSHTSRYADNNATITPPK